MRHWGQNIAGRKTDSFVKDRYFCDSTFWPLQSFCFEAECSRKYGGFAIPYFLNRIGYENRQDVAEYAILLAVVLIVVMGMVRMAGANANAVFSRRQGDSMAMISNYIHVKSSPSSVHGALASSEPNNVRLAMIALLLGWIWLAGLSSGYTMGGLVHLLPVVAIAIALVCLARQDRVRAVTKLFLKSALGRRRK
jgi:hypothetical protein